MAEDCVKEGVFKRGKLTQVIPSSNLFYCLPLYLSLILMHTHTVRSNRTQPPTHRWKFSVLHLLFKGELHEPYRTTGAFKAGVHMSMCMLVCLDVCVPVHVFTLQLFILRSAAKQRECELLARTHISLWVDSVPSLLNTEKNVHPV